MRRSCCVCASCSKLPSVGAELPTCAVDIRRRMVTLPAVTAAVCKTEDAFNDDEIAALRLSGSLPRDLRLPRGEHAGCAFRGPTGCSSASKTSQSLCVRYLCPDLFREVYGRGDGAKIEALCDEMEAVYLRFIKLRAARLAADE